MPRPSTYIKRYNAPISGQEALFDTSYRFGFNGKESDSEVKGEGNSLDFGARLYDSRLGRWLSLDPLLTKYPTHSPYNFVLNTPIIAVDSDGERVFFIINTGGVHADYSETRRKEIEKSAGFNPEKDIVVVLYVPDLGKLEEQIETSVAKYSGIYGKTAEVSFYGHGASDGPVGGDKTSKNNLAEITNNWDQLAGDWKQLSPAGWQSIDFNFDSESSTANFYGCNTDEFAQKFLFYSDVKNASGTQGGTGPSYTYSGEISRVWFNIFNAAVYQVGAENNYVLPMNVYSQDCKQATYRDGDKLFKLTLQDASGNTIPQRETKAQVYGNVSTDENGNPISGSE